MACRIWILLFVLACGLGASEVTIRFTHDLHANVQPYRLTNVDKDRDIGGFARIASFVRREKEADMGLWGRFNAVYAAFFGNHRPARTVVPTLPLHHGFQVEIDAVAVVP